MGKVLKKTCPVMISPNQATQTKTRYIVCRTQNDHTFTIILFSKCLAFFNWDVNQVTIAGLLGARRDIFCTVHV